MSNEDTTPITERQVELRRRIGRPVLQHTSVPYFHPEAIEMGENWLVPSRPGPPPPYSAHQQQQQPAHHEIERRRMGRTTRYLCITFFLTIGILTYTLFRMSVVSNQKLQLSAITRKSAPHQWEQFPLLDRYYGGLRKLLPRGENIPEYPGALADEDLVVENHTPRELLSHRHGDAVHSAPFNPYPDYTSRDHLSEYPPVTECLADFGLNKTIPAVHAYDGVPSGLPDAIMGSSKILGLRDDVCFDRFGRYGPYGLGYGLRSGGSGAGLHGDRDGIEDVWAKEGQFNFQGIRWAELQERCLKDNVHRFKSDEERAGLRERSLGNAVSRASSQSQEPGKSSKSLPRTAFLVRTWSTYTYTQEDVFFLRALIAELSLGSGGEYTVHILVHVRDDNLPIWASDEVYQRVLRNSLPEEFWGLGILWSERQMGLIYGGLDESFFRGLPVHGVYRSSFMPVQWFAHQHPEYDHFWHWEMDARYTGHYYHLLDRVTKWAREQPRKGLWERSSRFYVPSVHGSWEDFKQMVRVHTEMDGHGPNHVWDAVKDNSQHSPDPNPPQYEKPIWGPEKPPSDDPSTNSEFDALPPTSHDRDQYTWGVGEEPDLITFNPLFDPSGTTWLLADDVTGYDKTNPPPRRAAIVTVSRLSRRLLDTMHVETSVGRHTMATEMWPASCALHHGYKAVYVPHPVYIDRRWLPQYLAAIFNGGRNGASGGARTSVFGDRQHNFNGTTWYYNAEFAGRLYRRWLGLKVAGKGGEEQELLGEEGRLCLPGMLLHPIKDVRLAIEGNMGNVDGE
ncbi:MAG: hypothetical protein M1816_003743 [Peltula sp. TS41687]|nr:MAG: hypothetical protein M1816_003743 [Peltula sp. TS41687]